MAAYSRARLKKPRLFCRFRYSSLQGTAQISRLGRRLVLAARPRRRRRCTDRTGTRRRTRTGKGKNKFSQNRASNSARDLLLRQDEHRDKTKPIKRPIPGGAILPDGGSEAIPNGNAGGTPDWPS
jgi:hypothetical protein